MKKLFFFLLTLLCTYSTFAATITWTGNGSNNNWSNAANWDLNQVPTWRDDVILLNNSGTVRYNLSNGRAKSLVINSGSNVTINSNARLRLLSAVDVALHNESILTILGTLVINNSQINGLQNKGIVENQGTISMSNQAESGLTNMNGTFINRSNGRIEITSTDTEGIVNLYGTFINEGRIRFLAGGNSFGILTRAYWRNSTTGSISFEGNNPGSFKQEGGTVENYGSFSFSATTLRDNCILITSTSDFYNRSSGQIHAEGFDNEGILISGNSYFDNDGSITIIGGSSSYDAGMYFVGTGVFLNDSDGQVDISNVFFGISLGTSTSSMENNGSVEISNVQYGFYNVGNVLNWNDGEILINGGGTSINNQSSGVFENDEATITFTNTASHDVLNWGGSFINYDCSTIHGDGMFRSMGGNFINSGQVIHNSPGNNHTFTGNPILNDGLIVDPYNRFATALDNQKLRVLSLDHPEVNEPYYDALELVNSSTMEISDFYLDPGLKTFGGRYYQEDNVYVPNEKAAGAELLYAGVHFNKCYEVFEIQVEGGISEIAGGPKSSIAEQRSSEIASENDLKVQVYPNPSTGLVFLQLPKNIEGQVLLRLYDINGRQIWEQQQAANVLQSIDLSQTIPDGIYALQIWQKEQLLDQQKIVLTR